MASPIFPGVGTQSRIAEVQIAGNRLSLQQEEANRRSGLALLGLLSRTGLDIGQLIQQSREAGAGREFATSEREAGQEFRAGEALLDRQARATEIGDERRFATQERVAGQTFTTGRDEALAQQAADAATELFRREKELALEARQLLPQENFDRAVTETVQAVTEGLIAKGEAGQPIDQEAAQATIDQAVSTLSRNFPEEAQGSPVARRHLEREARRGEVESAQKVRDPFGFQAERSAQLERDRPALKADQRAAERRTRVNEVNRKFQQGELSRFEAENLLQQLGRPTELDIQAVQPRPRLSRQPNIFP